jgi:hypothetical protein
MEAKELQGMLENETKAVIGISPSYGQRWTGFVPGTPIALAAMLLDVGPRQCWAVGISPF